MKTSKKIDPNAYGLIHDTLSFRLEWSKWYLNRIANDPKFYSDEVKENANVIVHKINGIIREVETLTKKIQKETRRVNN